MAQLRIFAVLAVVWLAAPSAFAHHPFGDEFDRTQAITLSGTLTRLDWQNPHVFAYIDVKDAQGKVVNWKVEMGSPDALTKEGWTRTSVKPGDQVTIQGWRARNNVSLANAESFMLPDGKKIAAASSLYMAADSQTARAQDQPAGEQTIGTTGAADALPATASPLALEGLAVAIPWGFESPLPHQPLSCIGSSTCCAATAFAPGRHTRPVGISHHQRC